MGSWSRRDPRARLDSVPAGHPRRTRYRKRPRSRSGRATIGLDLMAPKHAFRPNSPFVLLGWARPLLGWWLGSGCLVGCPSRAHAEAAPRLELEWQAPDECPQRDTVVAKSRELLAGQEARVVNAEGSIAPSGRGFELILRTQVANTELTRRLWGRDCRELGDAAALILAMAARPSVASAPSSAGSPGEPGPVAAGPVSPQNPAKAQSIARRELWSETSGTPKQPWREGRQPLSYDLFVGSLADWGTLPSTTLNIVAGLGVRSDPWAIEGQYRHWFEREAEVVPNKGGLVSLTSGALQGCWLGHRGVEACAGLEMGRLAGKAYGTQEQHARSVLWIAGHGVGRFSMVTTRWLRLGMILEVGVPFRHYEFQLEHVGDETVHRPWFVCPRAGVWGAFSFGAERRNASSTKGPTYIPR